MRSKLLLSLCSLLALGTLFAADEAVSISQSVTITKGWNAIYINVIPQHSADELFESWPTDSISVYRTISVNDIGALQNGSTTPPTRYAVWHRDNATASSFVTLPGDSVLVFKASDNYSTTVTGTPIARQMIWENGATATNYFGISAGSAEPTIADYFSGLPTEASVTYQMLSGTEDVPKLIARSSTTKLKSGNALLIQNVKSGIWSGVFSLTPRYGVDFGAHQTVSSLSITNRSLTKQTISVTLNGKDGTGSPALQLYYCDTLQMDADAWQELTASTPISKELAPDETWYLTLGLDRRGFDGSGEVRAGVLTVASGANAYHQEQIPIIAKAYTLQSEIDGKKWPNGLWLLEAQMDTVTRIVSTDGSVEHDTPTASKMPVRLLMYVDDQQQMTLLQRVTLATLGDEGVKQVQILYGPTAVTPGDETDSIRLSTPLMPVDVPKVNVTGTFLGSGTATFTVGAESPSNPWKHAYHPEHDGLDWDFKDKAPSGDTFANYKESVKPELWSVHNQLEFLWDIPKAEWIPEEYYTGTLKWTISGLRHEAPILVRGPFTFRRILVSPTYQEN
ncbi:MAG: hypothetical protein IJV69_00730 [Kiritimatiellae bacterium]|nr:hypothetical protein [Kiritimatiellia bacterium]